MLTQFYWKTNSMLFKDQNKIDQQTKKSISKLILLFFFKTNEKKTNRT